MITYKSTYDKYTSWNPLDLNGQQHFKVGEKMFAMPHIFQQMSTELHFSKIPSMRLKVPVDTRKICDNSVITLISHLTPYVQR